MEKKVVEFDIGDMWPIALTFVIVGIGITYGLSVMADVRDGFSAGTAERNASDDAMEGIAKLPEKMPMIATVVVAAIIIGVLIRYMSIGKSQ